MKFSMVLTHLDNQRDGVLDVYNVDYSVIIDNSDHSGLATYSITQFLYTGEDYSQIGNKSDLDFKRMKV